MINVYNEKDLNKVDNEKEGIIVSGSVGLKNKIPLLKKAKEKGIKVLNLNVDDYLKKKDGEISSFCQKAH